MIRRVLLGRFGLLFIVIAFITFMVLFGRRVGLNEILIVGLIIAVVLVGNGLIFLVGQIWKGYKGE